MSDEWCAIVYPTSTSSELLSCGHSKQDAIDAVMSYWEGQPTYAAWAQDDGVRISFTYGATVNQAYAGFAVTRERAKRSGYIEE